MRLLLIRLLTILLFALPASVAASEGHDHDHAEPVAGALPRFTAASDMFELVGILDGRVLTVYLDRYADNSPVQGATLEIELGGVKLPLQDAGEGRYTATLPQAPAGGMLGVTATVTAGDEMDLLSGELDVHAEEPLAEPTSAWRRYGLWGAAAVAMLILLGLLLRRRRHSGAILPLLALALVALPMAVDAADDHGHDHGPATGAANPNGPQRLPDGGVFLPKPAQRQLGIRTTPTRTAELPRSVELNGRVAMDPNAGGRVQPLNAGRLEPGPRGFPNPGQTVRKGEVLAYVVSSTAPLERSSQAAQLAELRGAKALADKRVARLRELADTVPRKEIEAAEGEAQSLAERIAAVGGGLATREALTAPVSGVVASAQAMAGQVVDARELLFEIVDPSRLRIEALAFDGGLASDIGGATLAVGEQRVPLAFIGAARSLRDQALPLSFRAQGGALATLAVGQPVRVLVQSRTKLKGIAVPAASLMKNAANQTIVWVKVAPERFEPRVVTIEPLDGVDVVVTSGLEAGDRVATRGATLINQVR